MTKAEAIARQAKEADARRVPERKAWERNETIAIANLDRFKVIRFQHRRRVLKSGGF